MNTKPSLHIEAVMGPDAFKYPWGRNIFHSMMNECSRKKISFSLMDSRKQDVEEYLTGSEKQNRFYVIMGFELAQTIKIVEKAAAVDMNIVLLKNIDLPMKKGARIFYDIENAFSDITRHVLKSGRKKPALVGYDHNNLGDRKKLVAFKRVLAEYGLECKENDIYHATNGIHSCLSHFSSTIGNYDAALCTTDLIACMFLKCGFLRGREVPEDIAVSGFDNFTMGQMVNPSITTVTGNTDDIGKSSVITAQLLHRETCIQRVDVTCGYEIFLRASTGCRNESYEKPQMKKLQPVKICDPGTTDLLLKIEKLISSGNTHDILILKGLFRNITYTALADQLFMTERNLNYRIKSILKNLGMVHKSELLTKLEFLKDDILQYENKNALP